MNMWYCNKCKDLVRAYKQMKIYRPPEHLIIHLMRFRNKDGFTSKIETNVNFPVALDVSPFCIKQETPAKYYTSLNDE